MKGWADSRLNVTLVSCLLDPLPLHKFTQELLMIPTFKYELWSPRTDKKEYLHEGFVEKESIAYHFPERRHDSQQAYNHYYWSRSSVEGERSLLVCHNTTWASVIVMQAKEWASHSNTGPDTGTLKADTYSSALNGNGCPTCLPVLIHHLSDLNCLRKVVTIRSQFKFKSFLAPVWDGYLKQQGGSLCI